MYCKYCGEKIDEDSIFCSHCGKRICAPKASVEEIALLGESEELPKNLDKDIATIIQRMEQEFRREQVANEEALEQIEEKNDISKEEKKGECFPVTNEQKKNKRIEEVLSHIPSKASEDEFITAWQDKKNASYNIGSNVLLKGSSEEYVEYKVLKGVVCICDSAFYKNSSIQSVSFPKSLITIGSFAFGDCEKLKEVFLHKGIKTIKEGAFWGCLSLNDILFYEGLESIGDDAFYNCKSLKKITLPKSLKEIGERVFEGCTSLKTIFVPKDRVEFFREKLKMGSEIVKPKPTFWDW
ncbi:MAG TPA: hypothetical protein DDY68_03835 [Porphyromonadaceae bacterium]|nr:hypothetical protein [Porphyromonadaceae bacterium]